MTAVPAGRPYVLLSAAMSVDGHLDDASPDRLVLSSAADLDRVDGVRAGCDAVLVGANTVRRDDPRLLVRSDDRRAGRLRRGRPEHPVKVVLTTSGDLDPGARFFTTGAGAKVVYSTGTGVRRLRAAGVAAELVDAGEPLDLAAVLADLAGRGVRTLLVEGGTRTLTAFLTTGLADELQLAVAPFLVGDAEAPRFVGSGRFPHGPQRPMRLAGVRRLGDMVVLRYLLGTDPTAPASVDDERWLRRAVELSRRSEPVAGAFSVGAVVVGGDGEVLASGYSRERDPYDHAEEVALDRLLPGDPRLGTATLYSSLEPCTTRASRPRTCTELILAAGIPRVVFAWREPPLLADCRGAEVLTAAGAEVVERADLAPLVREVNAHLLR